MAFFNLERLIFNRATQPHDGELGQFEQYFYLYSCASLQKGCLTTIFKESPSLKKQNTLVYQLNHKDPFFPALLSEPVPPPVVYRTCPCKEREGTSECHYIPAKADAIDQWEDGFLRFYSKVQLFTET